MLIVFGGLPGVGKTTLAKSVARELGAVYLRVDTIEHALRFSEMLQAEVGPAGYIVAYRLAEENLRLGRTVVADSVNPLNITRDAWLSVAQMSRYGKIAVESLNVQGMVKNDRLARAISDVAWSSFVAVLTHKVAKTGGEVVQVSPNNTSQLCSACGAKVLKTLGVRMHRCGCGLVLDRDENAARNILERAWPGTGQWSVTPPVGDVLQEAVSL